MHIKNLITKFFLLAIVFMLFSQTTFSQSVSGVQSGQPHGTVLPATEISTTDCQLIMMVLDEKITDVRTKVFNERGVIDLHELYSEELTGINNFSLSSYDFMACGIKTGDIPLWMIPYFIRYFLEFILGLAGLISVIGLIYGGFVYLFAGLSEGKDKAKKIITNSLLGFVIAMTSYALVNIIMAVVTG